MLFASLLTVINAINSPQNIRTLARNNYKLVPYFGKKWVKKYNLNYEEQKELFQEGYIGYMKACTKYDESYGVKLSTYSYYWIRKYMDDYVHKTQNNKSKLVPINLDIIPMYDDNCQIDYTCLTSYEEELIKNRYLKNMSVKTLAEYYNRDRNTITSHCKAAISKLYRKNKI